MDKIQVGILNETILDPVGMTAALAKLTQRGHKIKSIQDFRNLYAESTESYGLVNNVLQMPHGSIIRHTPVTLLILGASRRVLTQIRTHNVGIDWVSASLQYSDYSSDGDFVVPYELFSAPEEVRKMYLSKCKHDLKFYKFMIENLRLSNDTAGYAMNHALRNVIVATANHEAWLNFINVRACNRNTDETAYVATLVWECLLNESNDGRNMLEFAGPDCLHGKCKERHMSCGKPISKDILQDKNPATSLIKLKWPLIDREGI